MSSLTTTLYRSINPDSTPNASQSLLFTGSVGFLGGWMVHQTFPSAALLGFSAAIFAGIMVAKVAKLANVHLAVLGGSFGFLVGGILYQTITFLSQNPLKAFALLIGSFAIAIIGRPYLPSKKIPPPTLVETLEKVEKISIEEKNQYKTLTSRVVELLEERYRRKFSSDDSREMTHYLNQCTRNGVDAPIVDYKKWLKGTITLIHILYDQGIWNLAYIPATNELKKAEKKPIDGAWVVQGFRSTKDAKEALKENQMLLRFSLNHPGCLYLSRKVQREVQGVTIEEIQDIVIEVKEKEIKTDFQGKVFSKGSLLEFLEGFDETALWKQKLVVL